MTDILERAFMARIRADEYREALAALQQEFDERPDVIEIKRRIERCEEERRQCIEQAKAAGISKQGSFLLKIRTRKQRTVIPERFFARFGAEAFVKCSTVAIGKAEALLGKGRSTTAVRSRSRISVRRLSMCARGCRSDPRTPLRHVLRRRHPGRSVFRRGI